MVEDRFLLHYSKENNWRLRNVELHPFDPGWEVGTYSVCHPTARRVIEKGTKIIDVVQRDGKAMIRSAFIVNRTKGAGNSRVLYFDEYFFADQDPPIVLPGYPIQYRLMTMKAWDAKFHEGPIWGKVQQQYNLYKIGEKPNSIKQEDWDEMVSETAELRDEEGQDAKESVPARGDHVQRC